MKVKLQQLDEFRWQIPAEGGMRVPGRIYASEAMIRDIRKDQSPQQVANVAHLPGIIGCSLAMPDMHWGYGFPIGGVAAFDADEGVLSPGGVGYDINCGVRLIRSNLTRADVDGKLEDLSLALHKAVPSGVGTNAPKTLTDRELEQVLVKGVDWAIQAGHGHKADKAVLEEEGRMAGANPDRVSKRARERGRPQLGSLGSGNHFCELGYVAEIYDEVAAAAYGLSKDKLTVMIHSGSRGFGYQVCDDAIRTMVQASRKYRIRLPDRQLCAAPLSSVEATEYFEAMACAINYAFANRQVMTQQVRQALHKFFGQSPKSLGLESVYDVCHNIAKWETHEVDGVARRVCVHRKGATRAFGPDHPDVPEPYRAIGQPVLVPGDMGRYSFILKGTDNAMTETFGSSCHGAGRHLSRSAAKKAAAGRPIFRELQAQGIWVRSDRKATVAEEIPEAYKDVSDVVGVMHDAGIAQKVAKLIPLAVVKG